MIKKTLITLVLVCILGVFLVWIGVRILNKDINVGSMNPLHNDLPGYSSIPTVSPSLSAKPTTTANKSPSSTPILNDGTIKFTVAFTSQAPLGEWSDERQQDGCEEASALMAIDWTHGITSTTPDEARTEILAISDWEQQKYNNYQDTSATDAITRIYNGYYKYSNVHLEKNVTVDTIIQALKNGNLVVIPTNGQALQNPYYTAPGPERHMLVIIGYDFNTEQFITNDPGTRHGQNYRYNRDILFNAIRDYQTSINGIHQPIIDTPKNIIVVGK